MVEASSGSTAVSEAYFAAMLGVPFIAVMPASTSASKIALIEAQGGRCHFVEKSSEVYAEAQRLADETGGHYLDQFTNAERATDWRGNNNIAESIYAQMRDEPHPIPSWIVVGAGTGGTSATIGRYIRYRRHDTRLCVVDPENSAFFRVLRRRRRDVETGASSRIEGIGRPARGTVVPARGGRPDDQRARRGLCRRGAPRECGAGPSGGTVDGHQHVGCVRPVGRDGRGRAQRFGGHSAGRQRRPLRRHLLLRRVGGQHGVGSHKKSWRCYRVREVVPLALHRTEPSTGASEVRNSHSAATPKNPV